MTRFYFELTDGETYRDNEGLELPDKAAAEREAAKIAAEWLRDNPDTFRADRVMKVVVLNEERQKLVTISIGIQRANEPVPLRPGQKN